MWLFLGSNITDGAGSDKELLQMQTVDIFLDLFHNMFPENIFKATVQSVSWPQEMLLS